MKFYTNIYTHGNQILERYIEDGERKQRKVDYEPTLYVNSTKQSPYKTIHGKQVEPRRFDSIRGARNFIQEHGKISNSPVYGMQQFAYAYINEEYPERKFDVTQLNVFNFDIETVSDDGFPNIREANKEVLSIAIRQGDKSIVMATPHTNGDKYTPEEGVDFIECRNEIDLLYKFIDVWVALDPDIVTGWNVEMFDIPYICNRIERKLSRDALKRLSPWGIVNDRLIPTPQTRAAEETGGKAEPNAKDIIGVTILDYLGLYRKFTYSQQESYSLDNIGFVELGEKKLDYSEYESLNELYKQNYQKFLDYNIKDVLLVERLDDKMKLIEQTCTIAYDAGVNLIDALTSVRMWDVIIHNFLMQKNIVVPPKEVGDKENKVEGAYVKDPQVGMHDWVVSFDLNSLYPHLIMQYNISPETFLRDVGFKPSIDDIIEGLYNDKDMKEFISDFDVPLRKDSGHDIYAKQRELLVDGVLPPKNKKKDAELAKKQFKLYSRANHFSKTSWKTALDRVLPESITSRGETGTQLPGRSGSSIVNANKDPSGGPTTTAGKPSQLNQSTTSSSLNINSTSKNIITGDTERILSNDPELPRIMDEEVIEAQRIIDEAGDEFEIPFTAIDDLGNETTVIQSVKKVFNDLDEEKKQLDALNKCMGRAA